MHGGAVTISDNPLMREGSLCKTSCSLGGVHRLATTLGGQHAYLVHFVPYGKGLKEMFGSALIKIRANAVQLAMLPGTSHILSYRKA